jgi:hypothetical protein
MVVPVLLLEYLVSGAIAFAWLLPLLQGKLLTVEAADRQSSPSIDGTGCVKMPLILESAYALETK